MLAIAHRLQTIIDYDKVLVLNKGTIIEYDNPQKLIDNTDSVFSKMLKESKQ